MKARARPATPDLYQDPALYDLIHEADTAAEAAGVLEAWNRFGNGGRRWLEPACGTGLFLAHFGALGFSVSGYDAEPAVVAAAKAKGLDARLGRMESFRPRDRCDLAFNLLGSFRHLMTETAALAHLELVAAALNPGGLYVVGLDLTDYSGEDDEETWEGPGFTQVRLCLAPHPRVRREKVIHFINGKQYEYELRSYDEGQWAALLKRGPLRLATATAEGLFILERR